MTAKVDPHMTASDAVRQVAGAFPLERALPQPGVTIATDIRPLSFVTLPERWAYAVRIPAAWPPSAGWIDERDGSIRVRLRVIDGRASVLALGRTGNVIDEVVVESTTQPVDADLVTVPLGACRAVVVRNVREDGRPSRVEVTSIECHDVWAVETGDVLRAPDGLALRPDGDWARYYGTHLSLPERLRLVRYQSLDRVKRMPWLEDLEVRIYPNDDLSRALYVSGLYEPSTMTVLRRVLPVGGVFVDVGANVGLFSMVASRWVGPAGRVYAFEPSQREHARLLDHVSLNQLRNVKVLTAAVGDTEGRAQLRVAPYPHAGLNTLGASFAYDVPTQRIETVNTTTIDRFAEQESLVRVDVIKMDIEGSERPALAGAGAVLRRYRPALIVEISSRGREAGGPTAEILKLLTAADYRIYRISPAGEPAPLLAHEWPQQENILALPVERSTP